MSNRSWFYASNGQQQGPFPEAQLRDLITRGTVRPDTLVWTEGMAGWQGPARFPAWSPAGRARRPCRSPAARRRWRRSGGYGGGPLSIDFGILEFVSAQPACS